MNRKMILVVLWSLVIIGIKGQANYGDDHHHWSRPNDGEDDHNDDDNDDHEDDDNDDHEDDDYDNHHHHQWSNDEEVDPEERKIHIATVGRFVRWCLDKELMLVKQVVLYYKQINEPPASTSYDIIGTQLELNYSQINELTASTSYDITGINRLSDQNAFALVYTTFFAFSLAVTLRIYSVFTTCIYPTNTNVKELLDFYSSEITFAFYTFKKEVEMYKAATGYHGHDDNVAFQEVVDRILTLSLDFVLSEETLAQKEPDNYVNGIINWDSIEEYQVEGKEVPYKTIFPSCSFIRKQFHKTFSNKEFMEGYRYIPYGMDEYFKENLEVKPGKKFLQTNKTYTDKHWQKKIQILKLLYKNQKYNRKPVDPKEKIFEIFMLILKDRLSVNGTRKMMDILDFFIHSEIGVLNTIESIRTCLYGKSWFPFHHTTFERISGLWEYIKKKTFVYDINTEERMKDVTELLRIIKEYDMVSPFPHHFL